MTPRMQRIAVVALLLLAVGGGYLLGLRQQEHAHPQEKIGSQQPKVQYTCSMHPFIIRDQPGSCPICGMALTPVQGGTTAGQGGEAPGEGIRIDPVTRQNMGVRTEAVGKRRLEHSIRAAGLVEVADDRQYTLTTKVEGWIERLHVDQLGQRVHKGQPMLELYSPELVAAQQEYLLALGNRQRLAASPFPEIAASGDRLLEAARTRLGFWDISPGQIQALERTGKPSKTLTLSSDHSGVVITKKVLPGARVMAGEELLQLADLSTVWINADIYEYELPWLKEGQTAQIELPMLGKTVSGRISYISPLLNNETRTVKARIEVANPDLLLRPAMLANVHIVASTATEALTVPATALLNSGKGQTVFVALGDGRFAPRQVTTGLRADEEVQILDGVAEGESVVVSAQFMLDSESRLREALEKMTAPRATPAPPSATPPRQDLDDLFK